MKITRLHFLAACAVALTGCQTTVPVARAPRIAVPRTAHVIRVDGHLDEAPWRRAPLVSRFVIAGAPMRTPQPTRAWLAWSADALCFAFNVRDAALVTKPASANERDVDPQDRVEIFLWSGRARDGYHCIEVSASGAVHDYTARFYRRFDDAWSPAGLRTAVRRTPSGYAVEGMIPRTAMEAMGFHLRPGETLRCGLFRADFRPDAPDAPAWITWVSEI